MNQFERRNKILEILSIRKKTTEIQLTKILNVSRNTIVKDIEILSMDYPIRTESGRSGGICVDKDWYFPNKYLNDEQTDFLLKFMDSSRNSIKDKRTAESILNMFSAPYITE